jgi:hypothetical protein
MPAPCFAAGQSCHHLSHFKQTNGASSTGFLALVTFLLLTLPHDG